MTASMEPQPEHSEIGAIHRALFSGKIGHSTPTPKRGGVARRVHANLTKQGWSLIPTDVLDQLRKEQS